MFAPRFSIRTILIVTTGFAFYFLLAGLGVRGHAWAGAIAIGVGSLAVAALVHASLFALCWIIAGGTRRQAQPAFVTTIAEEDRVIGDDATWTGSEEVHRDVN